MDIKKIYDISVTLGDETADLPLGPGFEQELMVVSFGEEKFGISKFSMIVHVGTHVDAPCHLLPHEKTVDGYNLERFVLPATVVEIKDKEAIKPEEIECLNLEKGQALLFKTDNSISGRSVSKTPAETYVYMTIEALEVALSKGVSLLGFDYSAAEKPGPIASLHSRCFQEDIILLEGLNLKDVPVGNYTLIALPLKLKGVDGSPVRAVLL